VGLALILFGVSGVFGNVKLPVKISIQIWCAL
jgi:hypothetical protein